MNQAEAITLLQDLSRAGVYRWPRKGLADLLAGAEKNGFAVCRISLAEVRDKADFMKRLATRLHFPDWFGHNWDALADCLSDLSWLPAQGYLLMLEGAEGFRDRHPAEFSTALAVFADAADAWRDAGLPFWVLVDAGAESLATPPGSA